MKELIENRMTLISKKDLMRILDISRYRLRRYVFTDLVLSKMNLTKEAYNKIHTFDLEQSAYIREHILSKCQ